MIRTLWYLCVMFLAALGCASAITVAPGGEAATGVAMAVLLGLAALCAGAALLLQRRFRRNPESVIFKSKTVSAIGIGIAAILTLLLLLGVIG
ncbi:MAG: hypothetical protein WCK89_16000 [bacterium]